MKITKGLAFTREAVRVIALLSWVFDASFAFHVPSVYSECSTATHLATFVSHWFAVAVSICDEVFLLSHLSQTFAHAED